MELANITEENTIESETNQCPTNANNVNKRETWIDVCKGLGVFLVFLGHLWYLSDFPLLNQMIYSFHIPMFFMLSGYVIKRKKDEKFKSFLSKKFMRLLLPTIIYIVITLPLYFIIKNPTNAVSILDRIFFFSGLVAYNDPCWYFIVLFEAFIVERLLNIKDSKLYIKILYACLFLLSGFLVYYFDAFLPFGLDKMLIALGFMVLGIILKDVVQNVKKHDNAFKIILTIAFIISLALWIVFGVLLNPKVSVYSMKLGNYWYLILSGFFGSISFFIFCYAIANFVKFLIPWGTNSIIIIGTHYVFVTAFKELAKLINIDYTWIYSLSAVVYTIVIILLYVLLCKFLNKHAPLLVGLPPQSKKT